MSDRPRRLRLRPGALVARARRRAARLPPGSGARAARRRRPPARAGDARGARSRPTRAAGRMPLFVAATAARRTPARRPARRARGGRRERRAVAPRRRRVRRLRGADRARPRARSRGIELADSVTLDPHKWLYQPYECGCLLVRDGDAAAPRVRDHARLPARRDRRDGRGELRRPRPPAHADVARAEGVALAALFGLDAFRATIDRCLDLAEAGAERIDESPSLELPRRRRSASSASAGASTATRTRRIAGTPRSSPRSSEAASASSRRRASRAGTCCVCASSGTRRGGSTSRR